MRAPDFWWSKDGGLLPALLSPTACLYGLAVKRRAAGTVPEVLPVPVVCVGNLVVGGAGKTPVALEIGSRLAARGAVPHFLSRGYRGRLPGPVRVNPAIHGFSDVGDEPLLLAQVAPTWVARDRAAGCRAAAEDGAGAIVMDDGFQNPGVRKDLSLVVIDTRRGFGNGRLIPAGPLRESVTDGLKRADAVVLMGGGGAELVSEIRGIRGTDFPILRAHVKTGAEVRDLAGRSVVAFAGLGDPGKFFATLEAVGSRVEARHGFPDHHAYADRELERLIDQARRFDAVLVTTAKDAVRLPEAFRDAVRTVTIHIEWEDEGRVDRLLDSIAPVSQ